MLGLAIANLNIFYYYKKKPPSPQFITTTLGGGVDMNDLAKILVIDEAKVNIKSINDHAISFYIQTDDKPYSCLNCNALTSKVHDYRIQKMNIPL